MAFWATPAAPRRKRKQAPKRAAGAKKSIAWVILSDMKRPKGPFWKQKGYSGLKGKLCEETKLLRSEHVWVPFLVKPPPVLFGLRAIHLLAQAGVWHMTKRLGPNGISIFKPRSTRLVNLKRASIWWSYVSEDPSMTTHANLHQWGPAMYRRRVVPYIILEMDPFQKLGIY